MKANEIRELPVEDLVKKIDSLEEEHFNLRFQARMGQLTNPIQLRDVKKNIARVKTILNEKRAAAKA
ncbi:MAG: 50S ribosomal protein L29 [Chitinispirillia bacterium]|nr:50S ribosomal protein L29 [Chitinispirillia bacterium]MCL2268272.1 50S ribosomal protein L29 [Chitinispirillia bacterium]